MFFKKLCVVATIVCAALFSGCASVDFYDLSKDPKENSGFLYYPPKPYLLIEQGKDSVSIKLISLPDLSKPHRVKHSEGLGTAEMGFEIENGMIKSFNSKSDSKAAEIVTSLASLVTSKAAIDTAAAATITVELGLSSDKITEDVTLKYVVIVFKEASITLQRKVVKILIESEKPKLFELVINIIESQINLLNDNIEIKYQTDKPNMLIAEVEKKRKLSKEIADQLNSVLSTLRMYEKDTKSFPNNFSYAKTAADNLGKIVNNLKKFASRSASVVGLYEIEFINERLTLRKVSLD